MPSLRIARVPFEKTNSRSRGLYPSCRPMLTDIIKIWGIRNINRVRFIFFAKPPTIKDDQKHTRGNILARGQIEQKT